MANGRQVERVQAPYGGMNADASPDYVQATQAPSLANLLPGSPGKVTARGPITLAIQNLAASQIFPTSHWVLDEKLLMQLDDSSPTTQSVNCTSRVATDVTATIGKTPASNVHARLGDNVFGAIVDTHSPALGLWDGSTITLQTNAPYKFTDVQTYAKRLFVLGGTVPGAASSSTPNVHTLYYCDPGATDLSGLDAWKDDVSGLVNQINYDATDTPVGLASCGTFMAILGSSSINVLVGSGSSNFAIKNVSKGWGCRNISSIIEVDDGFWFMSDRGLSFCDGVTVKSFSDPVMTRTLLAAAHTFSAALWNNGYIALGGGTPTYLYHIASDTWTTLTSRMFTNNSTQPFRSSSFPCLWVGRDLWFVSSVTQPSGSSLTDSIGGVTYGIPASWTSRFVRLGSPMDKAVIGRVVLDHKTAAETSSVVPAPTGWTVKLLDQAGTVLLNQSTKAQSILAVNAIRQREQFDVNAEADVAQLQISWDYTSPAPTMNTLELYDAYIESLPGANTAGF